MPHENIQKLTQFTDWLARMTAHGDIPDPKAPHFFVMEGEDAISALTSAILSVRELQNSGTLEALSAMADDLEVIKDDIKERLQWAIADQNLDDLENMFETMSKIKGIDWSDIKNEAFVKLCTHGHIDMDVFDYFLAQVPDINFKNPSDNPVESGLTALEYMITWFNYDDNLEQITKLLEAGADPVKSLAIAEQSKFGGGNPELRGLLQSWVDKAAAQEEEDDAMRL
jgi:hypothetical protein